ncbi:hypothetical protein BLA29_002884 [Euroglyphus maynei]|uniref:Insertion element IS150 protein InsJ-like helix-turn-helix domain-containing protein n=1 Tax=Euroglyphus maynei TaxID=6958 RepID=A0A1Y3B9J2_EURMA|nr:hypothetical protein BLA29_002884 [Euroglyphus maynei]
MNEMTKIPNEDCSDVDDNMDDDHHLVNKNDQQQHQVNEEEEPDAVSVNAEEDFLRGPGKRIDLKTKKLVVQMNMNGSSYTDISRQIGISRKSVRRIISNYKTFGLLEKKRVSMITIFLFNQRMV